MSREQKNTWTYEDDDGEEITIDLPGTYEVCHRCRGKGTHVNPSIDGHGISAEEWANEWDQEDRETYLSGGYDVTCEACGGLRVEWIVDVEAMPKDLRERYKEWLSEEAEYRRMCKMERDFGA